MNVLKTLARYFRFISISAFIFAPIFPLVMFALSKIVPSADADMQEYLMTALRLFCAGIVNGRVILRVQPVCKQKRNRTRMLRQEIIDALSI